MFCLVKRIVKKHIDYLYLERDAIIKGLIGKLGPYPPNSFIYQKLDLRLALCDFKIAIWKSFV